MAAGNRNDWCIARGKRTQKNGVPYFKGVVNSGGRSFSVVVWPVNDGQDMKVELWPWDRSMNGMRDRNYRR